MADYIHDIRAKTGHMPLILNAAAGVVINDQQQILLQQRTDTKNWSLPGGYMEYGETFEQDVIREVKEDAGLDVSVKQRIGLFDQGFTKYPNGDVCQVISVAFLVEPVGGKLLDHRTNETIQMGYFDFDNLPPLLNQQNKDMIAAARKLVEKV